MRILTSQKHTFGTKPDTNKIFVPMKHRFYPHNHVNKQGKSLLYLKLYEPNKTAIKEPIGEYVDPLLWDSVRQRVKENHPNAYDINLIIDNIEATITSIKTYFKLSQKYMSLEKFHEEFKLGTERIDFCQYLKNQIEHQFESGLTKKNTRKKESSVCKRLIEWRPKILFQDLTESVIDQFVAHRKKSVASTTVSSNLKVLKKYINNAIENGIRMPLNVKKIKPGSTNGNKVSMTENEYIKLKEYFECGVVKDNHVIPLANYLLACETGLRISDIQNLNSKSIVNGVIIISETVKTGKYQKILINKYALKILEMHPEILTVKFTDQHTNRMLKEILLHVGIKKQYTFHTARHTFATRTLRKGGKVEVLQKQLNHSNISETMNYVTIMQEDQDRQISLLDD